MIGRGGRGTVGRRRGLAPPFGARATPCVEGIALGGSRRAVFGHRRGIEDGLHAEVGAEDVQQRLSQHLVAAGVEEARPGAGLLHAEGQDSPGDVEYLRALAEDHPRHALAALDVVEDLGPEPADVGDVETTGEDRSTSSVGGAIGLTAVGGRRTRLDRWAPAREVLRRLGRRGLLVGLLGGRLGRSGRFCGWCRRRRARPAAPVRWAGRDASLRDGAAERERPRPALPLAELWSPVDRAGAGRVAPHRPPGAVRCARAGRRNPTSSRRRPAAADARRSARAAGEGQPLRASATDRRSRSRRHGSPVRRPTGRPASRAAQRPQVPPGPDRCSPPRGRQRRSPGRAGGAGGPPRTGVGPARTRPPCRPPRTRPPRRRQRARRRLRPTASPACSRAARPPPGSRWNRPPPPPSTGRAPTGSRGTSRRRRAPPAAAHRPRCRHLPGHRRR